MYYRRKLFFKYYSPSWFTNSSITLICSMIIAWRFSIMSFNSTILTCKIKFSSFSSVFSSVNLWIFSTSLSSGNGCLIGSGSGISIGLGSGEGSGIFGGSGSWEYTGFIKNNEKIIIVNPKYYGCYPESMPGCLYLIVILFYLCKPPGRNFIFNTLVDHLVWAFKNRDRIGKILLAADVHSAPLVPVISWEGFYAP